MQLALMACMLLLLAEQGYLSACIVTILFPSAIQPYNVQCAGVPIQGAPCPDEPGYCSLTRSNQPPELKRKHMESIYTRAGRNAGNTRLQNPVLCRIRCQA